jgi:hypothetical protein
MPIPHLASLKSRYERVKQASGKWNPQWKVWELRYAHVVALQLETRIIRPRSSS